MLPTGLAELALSWPLQLVEGCRMTEEAPDGLLCTYASIDSMEVDTPPRDLQDYWEAPDSYFIVQGASTGRRPGRTPPALCQPAGLPGGLGTDSAGLCVAHAGSRASRADALPAPSRRDDEGGHR